MKFRASALQALIRESLDTTRIVKDRPWAVEHEFVLTGKPGTKPDGFAIVLVGESGKTMRVLVDSNWDPQDGDQSDNTLKIEIDGQRPAASSTYVPVKFDSNTKQKIIVSNSPVSGLLTVAHAATVDSVPIVLLAVKNPFDSNEDIEFFTKNLGQGHYETDVVRFSAI